MSDPMVKESCRKCIYRKKWQYHTTCDGEVTNLLPINKPDECNNCIIILHNNFVLDPDVD